MVIEYIKRNQKMGFDGDKLVYKVYVDEVSSLEDNTLSIESPVDDITSPSDSLFS